jgi:hypothetical protein
MKQIFTILNWVKGEHPHENQKMLKKAGVLEEGE